MTSEDGWLIGYGMATATYPTNRSEAHVKVQILPDGRARGLSGTQDLGTGTYTVMTQIVADILGIPAQRVNFELGDTRLPQAPVSGGSQTSASVGSAVKLAALAARSKAIQLAIGDAASPLHGHTEAEVDTKDGRLFLKATLTQGETYADLIKRSGMDMLEAETGAKPGDEKKQYSSHAFGAQFAEVRVNPLSGEARIARMVGAFAAGRILNAKTAHSQVMGGMVWGIGMALHEQTVMDTRLGRIVNHDLAEYHVPRERRRAEHRRLLCGGSGHACQPHRRQGNRRDRHRGRSRRHRQRHLPRDRQAHPRPAHHAGQTAVTSPPAPLLTAQSN